MSREIERQWQAVRRLPFGRVRTVDKESLLEFVETPLQEAVGIMYDKNIPTVGSSCNINDYLNRFAWISVDYEFMTAQNRKIVDGYPHSEKSEIFNRNIGKLVILAGLILPINENDLPADVGTRAVGLAGSFYQQPDFLPKAV